MEDAEIVSIAARLFKLARRQKESQAEVDQLRDRLRAEFETRGTTMISAGKYRVRLTSYVRESFDTKQFKGEYPSLYRYYTKPQMVSKIDVLE